MIVDVISVIVDDKTKTLEIVKELTDDEGNSVYELHLVPAHAINGIAASFGIENPDDAIDLVLYNPYLDSITDEGETIIDRVRKCKERLSDNNKSQRADNRKTNLTKAGVHERYHPIDGLDPIDVIRSTAGVTTENILAAKDRLTNKKEKSNEPNSAEQRPREEGRSGSRRAYVSLGTDD